MTRLARDGTAKPVSRLKILRRDGGHAHFPFPCSDDHDQDWQPYTVNSYSCYMRDNTYIVWSPYLDNRIAGCRSSRCSMS